MKFYSTTLNIVAYVVFKCDIRRETWYFMQHRATFSPFAFKIIKLNSKEIMLMLLFSSHFMKAFQIDPLNRLEEENHSIKFSIFITIVTYDRNKLH